MAFPQVGVAAVVEGVNSFLRDMGRMDSAIGKTADRADQSGSRIGKVGSKLAGFGKAAGAAALTGVAALGAAIVGIGVVSLKTAVEFESAWAGVVKTTDGLVDEFGNLTEAGAEMQTEFRDLAKVVPIAVEELLEIGELGGQLGVASEDLIDFTEVIAAMGVSTNLSTEEAGTGLARLANVMGTTERVGSEAFSRLGSTIVALGNNSATTEADILSFAQRMAGAAGVAGVTEADMLGISAAFSSVGIQAQAGGTAVSKVFLNMNKAALEGGEAMEIFAGVAGLTADEFGSAWEEDAGAVFGEFVTGLGLAGDDAVAILDALEIKDSQAVRAFLSLAGAGDLVTKSMTIANEGWEENTALATEAETRYKTTESQMVLLKNTLKDVGITIGMALLPFFNKLLQAGTELIAKLGKALPGFLSGTLIPALERVGEVMASVLDVIIGLIQGTVGIDTPFEDFFPPGIDKIAQKVVRAIVPIVDMLKIEIPKAIATTKKFITGSLLPAFKQFGKFVLAQVVPAIIKFSQAAIAFAQQHGPAIRNIIIAIGAAFAAASIISTIAGIVAAIVALFNPITLIIGIIALLVAAWTENWFGIRDIITEVVTNTIIPALNTLAEFVTSTVIPALLVMAEFIFGTLIPAYIQFQILIWSTVIPALLAVARFVINTVIPALISFGEFLVATLGPIIQTFAEFMVNAFTTARDWIVTNWPTIQNVIETVIQTIQTIIQTVMQIINSDWATIWGIIQSKAEEIWAAIQVAIDTAITAVKTKIIEVLDSLGIEWRDNWEDIKRNAMVVWEAIQIAIDVTMTAIQVIVETVLSAIQAAFDTATSAISSAIDETSTAIQKTFGEAMDFLQTKAQEVWDAIEPIFQDGLDRAKAVLDNILPAMQDAGAALVDAVKAGVESAMSGLQDAFNDGLDALTGLLPGSEPRLPSPLRGLARAGVAIVDNIAAGLADAMPVLQAQLGMALNPVQQSGPVTNFGGNITNISRDVSIEVISNPASQPSEQAIFFDVSAALAAARGG